MPTNDFLPFATGGGANVESQAAYAADPTTGTGFQTGVAISEKLNKVWRQAAFMAAVTANMIFTTLGVDVLDNGDLAGKTTLFINTIKAIIAAVGYATLASPTFTGVPAAPTAAPGTNTTQLATTAFVAAVKALLAPLASPAFTGVPTSTTPSSGDNSTKIATTAYVQFEEQLLFGYGFFPVAWVKFTVSGTTPTIASQHGVTSVVRNSTGNYTVTITPSLVAGAVQITASDSGGGPNSQGSGPSGGVTTGANVLKFASLADTLQDPDTAFVQFF